MMITRVETPEQIAEIARLAAEIWHEYYVAIITVEQIDYMLAKYQSIPSVTDQIYHQGYAYYLLKDDRSSVVGYMAVQEEEGKLFLSKFYVAKEHRGKGYASQAIAFLDTLCRERSLSHIWLTVNRHNQPSIAVYTKKGFRIVREQVADIGNGYVMDDYMMEKEISE